MEYMASFQKIREIKESKSAREFIWPDEKFDEYGWQTKVSNGWISCEPLLIDIQTASAICLLHDALNEKNQTKLERWVKKDRAHFGRIVELAWKACS